METSSWHRRDRPSPPSSRAIDSRADRSRWDGGRLPRAPPPERAGVRSEALDRGRDRGPAGRHRFLLEVAVAETLRHPNVVTCLGGGTGRGGVPFSRDGARAREESLGGGGGGRPVPPPVRAAAIVRQVACGLSASPRGRVRSPRSQDFQRDGRDTRRRRSGENHRLRAVSSLHWSADVTRLTIPGKILGSRNAWRPNRWTGAFPVPPRTYTRSAS